MTNEERDTLLRETHDTVVGILAECKPCKQKVATHQEALYGNGQDGLKTRLAVLETGCEGSRLTLKQWLMIVAVLGGTGFFGSSLGTVATQQAAQPAAEAAE